LHRIQSNKSNDISKYIIQKHSNHIELSEHMYNNGISSMDILHYIENDKETLRLCEKERYQLLIEMDYIRQFIRNEQICIYIYLNKVFRYLKT
jgi:hypothetical protein